MQTNHEIICGDSRNLKFIENESIDLIVTSPPYPMIEMWDVIFSEMNEEIGKEIEGGNGIKAFELMNKELDKVWEEIGRVVKKGGIVCINIGDAVRTINEKFQLYSNHSVIIKKFLEMRFENIPNIIWRKQTNAPNKYMGSGMYPVGAYVTLEHEYILLFRKGDRRKFNNKDKEIRQESAFFWEERNMWFSDVWEFKGIKQKLNNSASRERSGAYPLELALRLIAMYSIKGDKVLDPFLGTGTTTDAAILLGRNSIGIEKDQHFVETMKRKNYQSLQNSYNEVISERIKKHIKYVNESKTDKAAEFKYISEYYGFEIKTKQEKKIKFDFIEKIKMSGGTITVEYNNNPTFLKNEKETLF